jgi:hypothetical protein
MYLEDLIVTNEYRGKGIWKMIGWDTPDVRKQRKKDGTAHYLSKCLNGNEAGALISIKRV